MSKAIISLFFVLTLPTFMFGQNLIVNGDFESGTIKGHFANGYPEGWGGWGVNGWHHSDAGYRRDGYGIAIWANDTGLGQSFPASEGEKYIASCEMIYHADEVLVNKNAYMTLEFYDDYFPNGTRLFVTAVGLLTSSHTAGQWYDFSQTVVAPTGTKEVRIGCLTSSTGNGSTGKAFWDNIELYRGAVVNDPDLNGDEEVNNFDFAKIAGVWQIESKDNNLGGEEIIDIIDLNVLAAAWLNNIIVKPNYELVWSDEFTGTSLDTANWTNEIGTGNGGWGNGEKQYYTAREENCRIEDGFLIIKARNEDYGGMHFTSARIKTQGKQSFKYGRIEAKIRMPEGGYGIWPAFWMLGDNISSVGWPSSGEIDIVEMMENGSKAIGTIHYGSSDPYNHNSNGGEDTTIGDMSSDYHVYAIEWDETQIRWYWDDVNYYSSSSWWSSTGDYPAPFNQPFFIILNFAIGSNWWPDEARIIDENSFPQKFMIDYVRVYKRLEQ